MNSLFELYCSFSPINDKTFWQGKGWVLIKSLYLQKPTVASLLVNVPLCKRLHQTLLNLQRDGIELQSQHLNKNKRATCLIIISIIIIILYLI